MNKRYISSIAAAAALAGLVCFMPLGSSAQDKGGKFGPVGPGGPGSQRKDNAP